MAVVKTRYCLLLRREISGTRGGGVSVANALQIVFATAKRKKFAAL